MNEGLEKQKDLLLSIKSNLDNIFIRILLSKVIIYKEKVEIVICKNQLLKMLEAIYYKTDLPEEIKEDAEFPITITKNIRISAASRNGSVLILSESGEQESNINPQLVRAVAKSYYLHNQILSGTQVKDVADSTYLKRVLELRFLSPKIIDSILNGTQPKDISLQKLFTIKTLNWQEQEKILNA